MLIGETIYLTKRAEWRAWLQKNHKTKKEIWLIYYKKHSGRERIAYDDAVEEALCFGWIDSIIKKIDDEKYAQKFTPRKKGSTWSALNIKRVKKMIKAGLMTEIGLALFRDATGKSKKAPAIDRTRNIPVPTDLLAALSKNKKARENFDNFAPGYRRLYCLWVAAAKREETRQKRINDVVKRSAKNIKPGML